LAVSSALPGAVGLDRRGLDVTDRDAVNQAVVHHSPEVVIHCAAYTDVDGAEGSVESAFAVNQQGAALVAEAAAAAGAAVVFVSTDYVFDGSDEGAVGPDHPVNPVNVYGASKAAGEVAVRASGARHAIVRTSWLFSHRPGNFVSTMFRLAVQRRRLRVVDDQVGCPTPADALAQALVGVADQLVSGHPSGTWHFAGVPPVSWHGLASEAIRAIEPYIDGPVVEVERITTDQWPAKAARPRSSILDCAAFVQSFGVEPPDWRAGVRRAASRWGA